jgi:hypothetical protein
VAEVAAEVASNKVNGCNVESGRYSPVVEVAEVRTRADAQMVSLLMMVVAVSYQ